MTASLVPIGDMERMAAAIAKSGLFGMKKMEEALALMIVAQAENRHPGSVAAEYHIIQGRPALKADAMLARFQQAGGKVAWDAYTDTAVSAVFTHEAGGSVKIEWTIERAKKAGLTGKDNWTKYPRQMLRARVISEGVRTCYPAVCVGIYTPEEVQDFDVADKPRRGRAPKDMGEAEIVQDEAPQDYEQNAGAQVAGTPQGGEVGPSSPDPAPAPSASVPRTRHEQMLRLCDEAGVNYDAIMVRAKVKNAEEMDDENYREATAMLRRKAAKRKGAEGDEVQP